jgi:hypothetical protein
MSPAIRSAKVLSTSVACGKLRLKVKSTNKVFRGVGGLPKFLNFSF